MNVPRLARVAALIATVAALVTPAVVIATRSAGAAAATTTVVSLTFDDGHSSHYSTLPILRWRGMRGTYYINSDLAGTSDYYLNWSQIHELAEAGNEIGGHTATHADLSKVDRATARREICDDRQHLLAEGFAPVASFAYPYAARNRTAEKLVAECGYASGRAVGDVNGPDCEGCPYAETMPPRNAFALRAPESADTSTTVAELQSYVTEAEAHGGGWVVLSFHGICADECTGKQSLDPAVFAAFLDWLGPRAAGGTVVRTVGEVMGAPPVRSAPAVRSSVPAESPPATSIRCDDSTCGDTWRRSAVIVTLSATDPDWSTVASTRYTTDGTDPATSPTAEIYSAPLHVGATTTIRYRSTDVDGHGEVARSQQVRVDTAAPAIELTSPAPGSSYPRGTRIVLSATAADGAGASGIRRVVFKDGSTTIRTDTTAPYQHNWTTATPGRHQLTAVATDVAGNVTTSAPVPVTITR